MDNLTKEQRHRNMQRICSKNTLPEKVISRGLKSRKINFKNNTRKIFGTPDIVIPRKKIAIFVDSDFWHGHPTRFSMPKTNRSYWKAKILGNKNRDRRVNLELKSKGWKVIRLWEYNIKHKPEVCIDKIVSIYKK
ncbi:MAG: very short patch repair endonuclease [Atribacterota bacterium]|jgi:DNA mismatch endonuclease (patch repair protein)|nr:very short patch repair endonuclease [Atribacterota bacterium]